EGRKATAKPGRRAVYDPVERKHAGSVRQQLKPAATHGSKVAEPCGEGAGPLRGPVDDHQLGRMLRHSIRKDSAYGPARPHHEYPALTQDALVLQDVPQHAYAVGIVSDQPTIRALIQGVHGTRHRGRLTPYLGEVVSPLLERDGDIEASTAAGEEGQHLLLKLRRIYLLGTILKLDPGLRCKLRMNPG